MPVTVQECPWLQDRVADYGNPDQLPAGLRVREHEGVEGIVRGFVLVSIGDDPACLPLPEEAVSWDDEDEAEM